MSLSRWSHSRWYIYEPDNESLAITGDGHVLLSELKNDFENVFNKLSENETPVDKKELYCYLKSWLDFKTEKISSDKYSQILIFLRRKGTLRNYLNYGELPDFIDDDPLISPKEVWSYIENNKRKSKTIDDFDYVLAKIDKFIPHRKIDDLFSLKISYKNSKNITVFENLNALTQRSLLFEEYPLIEGETYFYHKKENFFINDFKDKEKTILFLNKKIEQLKKKIEDLD